MRGAAGVDREERRISWHRNQCGRLVRPHCSASVGNGLDQGRIQPLPTARRHTCEHFETAVATVEAGLASVGSGQRVSALPVERREHLRVFRWVESFARGEPVRCKTGEAGPSAQIARIDAGADTFDDADFAVWAFGVELFGAHDGNGSPGSAAPRTGPQRRP